MCTTRCSAFFSAAVMACVMLCFSCTSSQAPVRPQTRIELLTRGSAKTWRMVEHSRPGSNTDLDKCLLDNTFVFSLSGEFVNDDGTDLCLPADGVRQLRGNWKFSSDSTRIVISGAGMSMTARISSLSDSKLVLEELAEKSGSVVSINVFEAR